MKNQPVFVRLLIYLERKKVTLLSIICPLCYAATSTSRRRRRKVASSQLHHHAWLALLLHTHTHRSSPKRWDSFSLPFSNFFSFSSLLHPCNYRPVRRGLSHVSRLREPNAKARQCLAIHHLILLCVDIYLNNQGGERKKEHSAAFETHTHTRWW